MKLMKIVVSGGWSYGNIGDEAIATATEYLLSRAFPGVEQVWTAYDPEGFARCHGREALASVHAIVEKQPGADYRQLIKDPAAFSLGEFAALLDEQTLFVMSGGGYFTEGWESQFTARLAELGIAAAKGAKIAVIGQSIGPVFTEAGREALRQALSRCDFVSVRDESTWKFLTELGIRDVGLAPDVANIIADVIPASQRQDVVNIMPASYSAYVSVDARRKENPLLAKFKKRLSPGGIRYKLQMRALVRELTRKGKVQFVMSTQWSWDRKFVAYLCKGIDPSRYSVINCATTEELCRSLSMGSFLISTKMHPLIISASYGIGAIGIAYNFKVDDYMRSLGAGEKCFRIDRIDAKRMLETMASPGAAHVDAAPLKASLLDMMERLKKAVGETNE